MALNKQKGNMYGFVTHTWNPIKGRCSHNCSYCYMHRFWNMMKDDKLRLDEKELKTNLGEGNFIFVGSSTDMWLGKTEWLSKVLPYIAKYPKNTYLFQTKAPINFEEWTFYDNQILGITLETNRRNIISKAPGAFKRIEEFMKISHRRKMVTIEPIMDFDVIPLATMIAAIEPEWVNIGADSGHNKLDEPPKEKILKLINYLEQITKVHQKPNLKRIL